MNQKRIGLLIFALTALFTFNAQAIDAPDVSQLVICKGKDQYGSFYQAETAVPIEVEQAALSSSKARGEVFLASDLSRRLTWFSLRAEAYRALPREGFALLTSYAGIPLVMRFVDDVGNISALSEPFVLSDETVNSRYNRRKQSCIL